MKYLRLWKKTFALAVAEDFAYKWNFLIKAFALVLVDFLGPLVALLIYQSSAGIPGWSFEEFILFTGTVTLVLGIGHTGMYGMPWKIIDAIKNGEFDRFMVKPMNTLAYMSLDAWDLEGFAEVLAGLVLVGWAGMKLAAGITFANILIYIALVLAACLFLYAAMVYIAAMAFLVVKSYGLFDLFFEFTKFSRWPLNIFGVTTRIVFTFIIPLGIAAHYPTTALLHGMKLLAAIEIVLPILVFFALSLLAWKYAMRRHTSAGG